MTINKKALMTLGVLVVVLVAVGYTTWYLAHKAGTSSVTIVPLNGTSTTQGTTTGNTVALGGTTSFKAPMLERTIPASSVDIDPSVRPATIKYLNDAIANLKKNPSSYQDWVNLGLGRKMLGDYVGAEEAWMYAARLAPAEEVAYANLGHLYMNSIPDGAKSELYFRDALTVNPKDAGIYRALFELYTYHYKKDTNAGEMVLKEGIEKIPQAYDLSVLLARYYKDHGRIAEARAAYSAAAEAAAQGGYGETAVSIRAERDQLN